MVRSVPVKNWRNVRSDIDIESNHVSQCSKSEQEIKRNMLRNRTDRYKYRGDE